MQFCVDHGHALGVARSEWDMHMHQVECRVGMQCKAAGEWQRLLALRRPIEWHKHRTVHTILERAMKMRRLPTTMPSFSSRGGGSMEPCASGEKRVVMPS